MGLDYRDWEENQGPPRTDTLMLLTIDPVTMTAGMISIPRDLWVNVPGFGNRKINVAYRFGELYKLPGGGPGLAKETVEELLGVPIDYYAQIDFFAFEQFIDEIGGVQVDVPEEIKVDPIGKGNTVILQPGVQTLGGPTALGYARNRHTEGGDFDRAERQQQVILAIRDRVLSLNALPRLVLRAPQLYAELNAGIHTDMSLEQVIQLAWLAQQVPDENIERAAIGPKHTAATRTPDNQAILEPNYSQILILRDEIFGTDLSAIQAQGEELLALVSQENASIRLIDSSGKEDLGSATAQYLRDQGLQGVQEPKLRSSVNSTKVTDYTGNPYTLKFLVEVLNIDPRYITNAYDPASPVDMEVILGADWARENNLP
jgi:LCP family protein required for cell wall assembly